MSITKWLNDNYQHLSTIIYHHKYEYSSQEKALQCWWLNEPRVLSVELLSSECD